MLFEPLLVSSLSFVVATASSSIARVVRVSGDDGLRETERVEGFRAFGELKLRWRRLLQPPSLLAILVTVATCSAPLSLSGSPVARVWVLDFAAFDSGALPLRRKSQLRHQPSPDACRPLCRTPSLRLPRISRVSRFKESKDNGEDEDETGNWALEFSEREPPFL